jgi:hypothetical protein
MMGLRFTNVMAVTQFSAMFVVGAVEVAHAVMLMTIERRD